MPFIPHTNEDIQDMLEVINVTDINQLFDEIPEHLHVDDLALPVGMSEQDVSRYIGAQAPDIKPGSCFIGAGAYEHHIPAAVWDIVGRGEFYSAYTPYQAEASQATLQLIYEYQTIMCRLLGLDVSNASMYDGATALTEAVFMAVRIKRGKKRTVLVPTNLHPIHRKVLTTFLPRVDIHIQEIPFCDAQGRLNAESFAGIDSSDVAAMVIPQPNFLGILEDVDMLVAQAKTMDAITIAYVNPMAMSLLKQPGAWGENGVDIACGEGQPLGIPLASGGPYFGFMCCRKEHVRQMPGRIVGRTNDKEGREGFVLTLQAREQHIRRAKATSNICTNQGLMVTAATIYTSIMGARGLREVAGQSHNKAVSLQKMLAAVPGVALVFSGPCFHEFVIKLPSCVADVQVAMNIVGLQPGYALQDDYPHLKNCLLVCVTETKTEADLVNYVEHLQAALSVQKT
jgi:glycine dehydrogenase subunit 1